MHIRSVFGEVLCINCFHINTFTLIQIFMGLVQRGDMERKLTEVLGLQEEAHEHERNRLLLQIGR